MINIKGCGYEKKVTFGLGYLQWIIPLKNQQMEHVQVLDNTLFMAKSQVLTPFWSLNPPSPQFHHVSPKQHAREDHGEQRKALHHHLHYGHGHASAVMSNQQMH